MRILMPNFKKRGGILPIIVQDNTSKEVLMHVYTNKASFLETIRTGKGTYYSTSRKKRWKKGEISGAVQDVRHIKIDCDGDALIYFVDQLGDGACHTGSRSCFFRTIGGNKACACPHPEKAVSLAWVEVEIVKVGYHYVDQSTI